MSRITAFLVVLAVLPLAGLTACGSDDSDGSSASATTPTETTAAAPAATTVAPATTAAPATTTTKAAPATKVEAVAVCHKDFDPFIANLRKLNNEVAGGPDYKSYTALTNQLIARYSKLHSLDTYSPSCEIKVNQVISNARLFYVGGLLNWEKCRKEGSCAKTIAEITKFRDYPVELTSTAVKGFHKVTAS
jgi:hypothetical protein